MGLDGLSSLLDFNSVGTESRSYYRGVSSVPREVPGTEQGL